MGMSGGLAVKQLQQTRSEAVARLMCASACQICNTGLRAANQQRKPCLRKVVPSLHLTDDVFPVHAVDINGNPLFFQRIYVIAFP